MENTHNILNLDKNEVPTITTALNFVGKRGDSYEAWKIKALGLRQVLLGLAEVQALRISKLSGMVYRLEEELMGEEKLRELDPKQLYGLYRTATEQMQVASDYITQTLKSTNWSDFEGELLQSKASELSESADSGIADISGDLLTALARAKAEAQAKTDAQKEE